MSLARLICLIALAGMAVPAPVRASEEAATRLIGEAAQIWNRALSMRAAATDEAALRARLDLLHQVEAALRRVREDYPTTLPAIRLRDGGVVATMSLARVEAALRNNQAMLARVPEARAVEADAARSSETSTRRVLAEGGRRDCPECPILREIPAGRAKLASGGEAVLARPLLVGAFEVTFAEWDACVAAGGCSHRPADRGWGRGERPAIYVSWNDAQAYVAWLSRRTGQTYRLLTEAEWEYAAQAGSDAEARSVERGAGGNCRDCGSRWDGTQTAPVGSFAPNAFGLYDMLGNVWEWTADCFGEPTSGECQRRTLRGGAWNAYARLSRSGYRSWFAPSYRFDTIGFRVARAP